MVCLFLEEVQKELLELAPKQAEEHREQVGVMAQKPNLVWFVELVSLEVVKEVVLVKHDEWQEKYSKVMS